MSDYVIRATAADGQIRAFAATTRDMVEEARRRHDTSPVITAALGRLMTAAAMMGSMMKGDRDTLTLFGYIEIEDEARWSASADTAINRKWWDYMADIMETNPDNSPVCIDLHPVFHLD